MTTRPGPGRPGFTLLELTIASGLTGLLGLMLATAWSAYDRAAAGVVASCRLAQEADLALRSLADDLASTREPDAPGGRDRGRPTGLEIDPDGGRLRIAFDDPLDPSQGHAVVYEVRAASGRRRLVRWVETIEPATVVEPPGVVAWEVESLGFAPITSGWWTFRVTLGLPFVEDRQAGLAVERTYTLVAPGP